MRFVYQEESGGGGQSVVSVLAFKRGVANRPPGSRIIECLECGGEGLQLGVERREFCCNPCRMAWHKRRRDRGAEIYDLFMACRFERGKAKLHALWTLMSSLASAYRDADNHKRAGRRSWRRIDDAVGSIPSAFGRQGDGR